MNGREIEALLQLIEENVDLTRKEAVAYIRNHQQQIVHDLARSGCTEVKTSVGDFSLTLKDLTAAAA